ncbi:hypothetical protein V1478_010544, partial [Vespula squamosa]
MPLPYALSLQFPISRVLSGISGQTRHFLGFSRNSLWKGRAVEGGRRGLIRVPLRKKSFAWQTFPICLYEFFLVKIAVEAKWFYPSSRNFKKYPRIEDESDFR